MSGSPGSSRVAASDVLPAGARLGDELRAAFDVADAFGDALLAFDADGERVIAVSIAARRIVPRGVPGAPRAVLEAGLPGLAVALDGSSPHASTPATEPDESARLRGEHRILCTRLGGALLVRIETRQVSDAARRGVHDYLRARDDLFSRSRTISVSEMATALAHEINQPVGTVVNLLRGARRRIERDDIAPGETLAALVPALEAALEQALYTSSVIARIRDFTRSRRPAREPIDVSALVARSLALLDWLIEAEGCRLESELSGSLPRVTGDPTMLQQVLVNLIRNAVEAMLETPRERRALRVCARVESGRLALLVEDRGRGLGGDELELFVPFATTKPDGMGVGLNICRSFVELHGGRLWLAPNEQGGCTARVELPLDTEEPA